MPHALAVTCVFVTLVECILASGGEWHWTYAGEEGPGYWLNHHEKCSGHQQSPIDIPLSEVVYDPSHHPIEFRGYNSNQRSIAYTLKNNGHAVQVDVTGGGHSIAGGKLPGEYNLGQFHFHWGAHNDIGSEHLINGKQFPLEMHLVHYHNKYGGIGEAKDHKNGLAVVGIMFEVGNEKHPTMDTIIRKLVSIKHQGQKTSIPTFPLADLLPSESHKYFRYSGSLTTPTCDETVVWTVLYQPVIISQSQMDAFRKGLYEGQDTSHELENNYRPPQPLFGRTIFSSFEAGSSATPMSVSLVIILVSLCFNYII